METLGEIYRDVLEKYHSLTFSEITQLYFVASHLWRVDLCQQFLFRTNRMLLSRNRSHYYQEIFSQNVQLGIT
jgi:hypothetical protein